MFRIILFMLSFLSAIQAHAFSCFVTMIKDTCWSEYNVTVKIFDATTQSKMATFIIPQGSSWDRQKFNCEPSQKIRLEASFTPVFWEQDRGKVYSGLNFRTLPAKVHKGESAWHMSICFPGEFSQVPMPPEATNKCQCVTKGIPPVPLQ